MDKVRFFVFQWVHWAGLFHMYSTFEPKGAYQGLPPFKEAVLTAWLESLLNDRGNVNFVLQRDEKIFAHAALVNYPDKPWSKEIIIFVHQSEQHKKWGRKLFLAVMEWACRNTSLMEAWLTVDWHNLKARRMYSGVGFERVSDGEMGEEVHMSRKLNCVKCLKESCPVFCARHIFENGKKHEFHKSGGKYNHGA